MKNRLTETANRIREDIRQYGLGLLAAAILYFIMHALFDAFCPSVLITGFPCPGCGMTRAVLYLLKGQLARSWELNPAAVFWVLWAVLFVFERYGEGKGKGRKALVWSACGILLFMVAVYIIRMRLYFPDRPPYTYKSENLFSRMLPGYGKTIKYLIGR